MSGHEQVPRHREESLSKPRVERVLPQLLTREVEMEVDDLDHVAPEDGEMLFAHRFHQAALLAELAARVWSVEIVEEFAAAAELLLRELGHGNVAVRVGDGSRGWPEHAPFDRILVTAAARQPPPPLIDQLKPGGRMVIPLGTSDTQQLCVVEKRADGGYERREVMAVRFTQLETAT